MKRAATAFLSLVLLGACLFCKTHSKSKSAESPSLSQRKDLRDTSLAQREDTKSSGDLSEDSFRAKLSDFFYRLPRREDVKPAFGEQAALPSKELLSASPLLGEVNLQMKESPELAASGMQFFLACAEEKEILSAVRATCLTDLRYWGKVFGKKMLEESTIAEPIRKLADQLPYPR